MLEERVSFIMPEIRKYTTTFCPPLNKNCYPIRIPKQMMMLSGFTKVPKNAPRGNQTR